jgi:L-alanine-DL-glutamate epimerase-like enolase superfamily enzyme
MSIEQVVEDARASVRRGIGDIKIKVGHPDALVEKRRDGSMYDLAEISEAEARAIMECARASYLRPGAG